MRRVPTNSNTSHSPNLLGAHRCTIFDGTCALPRVSCRGRCPCCEWAIGESTIPLRRKRQRLPHGTLSELDGKIVRLRQAQKVLRDAERRIADAKVSQHTHFRRQQRWK